MKQLYRQASLLAHYLEELRLEMDIYGALEVGLDFRDRIKGDRDLYIGLVDGKIKSYVIIANKNSNLWKIIYDVLRRKRKGWESLKETKKEISISVKVNNSLIYDILDQLDRYIEWDLLRKTYNYGNCHEKRNKIISIIYSFSVLPNYF